MNKHYFLSKTIISLLCLLMFSTIVLAQKTSLSRVHENVRGTAYPQKFHTLYINPSPLIIPERMKTDELIQFELSMDSAFPENATITSAPKPWLMFNPHRILKTGKWFWRVRNITSKGEKKEWSETFEFTVTGEEPQFVTPEFDVFYRNMPKGYPRLYCFLEKDLKDARKNITSHPEYKDMTGRANTAMKSDFDTAKNTYRNARKNNSFIVWLNTAYLLTGDTKYSDKMVTYVRNLINSKLDSKLLKDDFYSGELIESLLYIYDSCNKILSTDELDKIEAMVFEVAKGHHMVQRQGHEETHIFNNHYWQHCFRQMMQVGLMFADKNKTAYEMLEYCYEVWTARAPASGFNRDGEWHNGTGYFTANTHTLYYVPSLFSYITGTDFLKHPWYQNAGRSLLYAFPVGTMSAGFGDGNERQPIPDRQRMAFVDFLARETGNPYAAWYANHCSRQVRSDFEMRLYRMARSNKTYSQSKELPKDRPNAVWLEDIGEVLAHSAIQNTNRNLFLSFRSSQFGSGSHTLADQNSFNLHFRGVPVYRSTGYYLNFSDAHNLMSYRHTRAHNTILVDGIGQPFTTRAYGKITRMLNGENITYALGDASNAYCGTSEYPMWIENFKKAGITQTPENGFGETPLKKYRRHIFMLHPNIVVIYDELEATKPVTWDWMLHSPVKFNIDNKNNKLTTRYDSKNFTSIAQIFSNQSCEISQTDQFVCPPDPKKMKKGQEDKYVNQWHMTAKFQPSKANRILTIIRIQPDEQKELNVNRKGNIFSCEKWNIEAELDPSKPASLRIVNTRNNATFSLGNGNVKICDTTYQRLEEGSSVLYDNIDGEWLVHEMSDYEPLITGAR